MVATLGLVPLLWLMAITPGALLWSWQGLWGWVANGVAAAAMAIMLFASAGYDMGEFFGLRQWRDRTLTAGDGGPFALSTLHRFVRHPWYCLGLIIVWSRDMNESMLVSALAITVYFLVGSRLEETKLIALYGDTYRHYRQRVPGLIPLPWKTLSRADAAQLLASAPSPKEHRP
jgi:protein-S-isoprenylcysteine O-methyltransferase Ste14